MRLPRTPKTEYTDYYDQARFNLVWYMSIVFAALILVLTVLNLSNDRYAPFSYILAFSMAIFSIITLYKFRTFKLISKLIAGAGYLILTYTFLGLENVIQYTTPMWVVVHVLFVYFTLGRTWGWGVLIANFITIGIFFFTKFQTNLANIPVYTDADVVFFVIEYSLAGLFIAYLLHMFVTTTYYAERSFKLSNSRLNNQNNVISKQNEVKEVMIKEIHHRVKNNLQVITSLLRLQSYEIEDENNASKFHEAIARVNAMALIHEKMYRKDMLENFDLKNYIRSLTNDLLGTYNIGDKVEINVDTDMESVGSRTIVPLALLFNELISNSLKHAFSNIEDPKVTIKLVNGEDATFDLFYSDNGKWKDDGKTSFGQELILSMTEQLDGSFKLQKTESGTLYAFKLKNLNERFDEKKTQTKVQQSLA